MDVTVYQTGQNCFAFRVYDPRARPDERGDNFFAADDGDFVAANRERFGAGEMRVHVDDIGVANNEVGGRRSLCGKGNEA